MERGGTGPAKRPGHGALVAAALIVFLGAVGTFFYTLKTIQAPDLGPIPLQGFFHLLCWSGVVFLALAAVSRFNWLVKAAVIPGLVVLAAADGLLTANISRSLDFQEGPRWVSFWEDVGRRHVTDLDLTPHGLERAMTDAENPIIGAGTMNLITKTPLFHSYNPYWNRFHANWINHGFLSGLATGKERIWFAPNEAVAEVHLSDATFQRFRGRTEQLLGMPLLLHSREAMLHPADADHPGPDDLTDGDRIAGLPAAVRLPAEVGRYTPVELVLRVQAPAAGYLLVTDRWARGWRAIVNGRPAEVLGGNFIFRAVAVEAGDNEVAFRYRPFGYPGLVFLSWGTLAAVLAWSLAAGLFPLRPSAREDFGTLAFPEVV